MWHEINVIHILLIFNRTSIQNALELHNLSSRKALKTLQLFTYFRTIYLEQWLKGQKLIDIKNILKYKYKTIKRQLKMA